MNRIVSSSIPTGENGSTSRARISTYRTPRRCSATVGFSPERAICFGRTKL